MYRLENISHNEIHMMAESRYVVLIYMTKVWCMLHPRRTSGLQTDLFFYLIRSHDHLNKESLAHVSLT